MTTKQVVYMLLAMLVAAAVSFAATPLVKTLACKVGAIDVPKDNRRMHKVPIPRMGGLAIFLAFLLSVLVFAEIDRRFDVSRDAEVSLEANPDSVTLPMLTRLRRAGFNRISIGVQTDSDEQLKALGRPHNYRQAQQAVVVEVQHGLVLIHPGVEVPGLFRGQRVRRQIEPAERRPEMHGQGGEKPAQDRRLVQKIFRCGREVPPAIQVCHTAFSFPGGLWPRVV